VETIAADLSQHAEVVRVAKDAIARLGRLDILVNNAGAIKGGDFSRRRRGVARRVEPQAPRVHPHGARGAAAHARSGRRRIVNVVAPPRVTPPSPT